MVKIWRFGIYSTAINIYIYTLRSITNTVQMIHISKSIYFLPQHFLYFFPLSHKGQIAFGLIFFFVSVFAGPIIPLNDPGSAKTENS